MPDVDSCRALVDELESAGVPERHLHVIGSLAYDLGDLPTANALQRSEVALGLEWGIVYGAAAGLVGAYLIHRFPAAGSIPLDDPLLLYAGFAFLGALFGAIVLALMAKGIPNHHLRRVQRAIDRGELLVMVDVPKHEVGPTNAAILRHHPEAQVGLARPPA
jgi:hypothetical protein